MQRVFLLVKLLMFLANILHFFPSLPFFECTNLLVCVTIFIHKYLGFLLGSCLGRFRLELIQDGRLGAPDQLMYVTSTLGNEYDIGDYE